MYIAIVELKSFMDLLYEFVKGIIGSACTKCTCVSGSPEPQKKREGELLLNNWISMLLNPNECNKNNYW